jgi:uncharacterized RDD family membrane protein YckC
VRRRFTADEIVTAATANSGMQIYILKNDERLGPYTVEEVSQRLAAGHLLGNDWAWHEGLSTWTPLGEVVGSPSSDGAIPLLFEQQPRIEYAGFWMRVAAQLLDVIALSIPGGIMQYIIAALHGSSGGENLRDIEFISVCASILLSWLYFSAMESSSLQATLGKLALGIRVTDMKGQRLSFVNATGRFFGKIISALILCIAFVTSPRSLRTWGVLYCISVIVGAVGCAMAGFTQRKQALHDLMAGCLVVRGRARIEPRESGLIKWLLRKDV